MTSYNRWHIRFVPPYMDNLCVISRQQSEFLDGDGKEEFALIREDFFFDLD